jgi:hypothetical protein
MDRAASPELMAFYKQRAHRCVTKRSGTWAGMVEFADEDHPTALTVIRPTRQG